MTAFGVATVAQVIVAIDDWAGVADQYVAAALFQIVRMRMRVFVLGQVASPRAMRGGVWIVGAKLGERVDAPTIALTVGM
jgi:hypothetical protein